VSSRECFVIQRKLRDGTFADWINPMTGQVEYGDHKQAVFHLIRRANVIDYRIVRRVHTYYDMPVGLDV
jgi:hypothetical protein